MSTQLHEQRSDDGSGEAAVQQDLETEIEALNDLDLKALRQRWQKLCGRPAPVAFRRKFLIRALAYQIQVKAFGGLSADTKRRLRQIAEAARLGKDVAEFAGPHIKPGTQLYRSWNDITHCVTVMADGFDWQGKRYRSLSAVAKAITGTQWNGYAFFGLKSRAAQNQDVVKRRKGARRA